MREAIARYIDILRGVQASTGDITITAGAQQAIDVIGGFLHDPLQQIFQQTMK